MYPIRAPRGRAAWAALVALVCAATGLRAQTSPVEGLRDNTPRVHALTNARIVRSPDRVITRGTLIIRDGRIEAVGDVRVPPDARVWDYAGRTVYPGLIDARSHYGIPNEETAGSSWSPDILADRDAAALFTPDPGRARTLRSQGVTAALVIPRGGVFSGTSALVSTGDGDAAGRIILPRVAQHIRLAPSASGRYPASLMGAMALVRQTLLDAQWYERARDAATRTPGVAGPAEDRALGALAPVVAGREPVVIEVDDELTALRADAIAREFSLTTMLGASGSEYRRLEAVRATGWPLILPLDFAPAPAVGSPEEALQASLRDLRAWDEEPENPARLHRSGAAIAFGSNGLARPELLLARARSAVRRGLPADAALAAFTTTPARLFGAGAILGTLDPGKRAHLVVTDGDLFTTSTSVLETWVDGTRYPASPDVDPRGRWLVGLPGFERDSTVLVITGTPDQPSAAFVRPATVAAREVTYAAYRLTLVWPGDSIGRAGTVRMTASVYDSVLRGRGEWPDGTPFDWSASRLPHPDWTPARDSVAMASFPPAFPYGAFGRERLPDRPAALLVRGATVWTGGPEGVIEKGDLLIRDGRIAAVGQDLAAPSGAMIIDAAGKHVTPGLIDAHSHMAISGAVNEATQAVTAEVRIGDVVDSDDISLYRALAGGLTIAHALHGSANPIGGQSQVVKLRWGMLPGEMKFTAAAPTIKFALGENVKQSNWGERFRTRYPQTRMGVEQIMRDALRAALAYERAHAEYSRNPRGIPPRRDLELEALVEVIRGERMVHCHSYRQDEILAMMRVAEEFGFTVAVFQHILEGYKVAAEMAEHGAAGSSFTDWWAYKMEVYDAIPDNGAIMHDQGVLVTFNSDSDELARRMNLEAAKAVKYGGLSAEEALNFVTINAARQLRADDRVGSLEAGKDADFVIWSGPPLSTYSRCEQTWIEGRRFFDLEEDRALRSTVDQQRTVLVQKILSGVNAMEADGPGGAADAAGTGETHYSCRGGEHAR